MKKLILSTSLCTLVALGAFAQGSINIDNLGNSNPSTTATSGGLFFIDQGAGAVALPGTFGDGTFNLTLLGGSTAGNLAPIVTTTMFVSDPGTAIDISGSSWSIPGTSIGGTGFVQLQVWEGTASSYAAAVSAGALAGQSAVFSISALGGDNITPPNLAGMPAVIMGAAAPVPEPGTFALAGLGAAAMLIFRRRK